jgi:tetratricopeptide (TPR) repeat protein
MKNLKTLFVIVLILSSQLTFSQEAKELFKTEFPSLTANSLQGDQELSKEETAKYRFQFQKLKKTSKEIDTYKHGGATEENMTVFGYKDLRSLERSETIDDLDSIVSSKLMSLKSYMADKTRYGADSVECIEQSSILKTLMDAKDYKNAYLPWKMLYTYYPISSKNIYIWGEEMLEEKIESTLKKAKETQIEAKTIIEEAEPLKETDVKKYNEEIEKANEKLNSIEAILEVRDQWVDTLLQVFDQRIEYYGDDSKQYGEGYLIGKKGVTVYKYQKKERLEDAYNFLKKSVKMQKDYPSLAHLQYFFFASDEMYERELHEAETVVEDYTLVQDVADNYIEKLTKLYNQKQQDKYLRVIESAEKVAGNITDKFTNGAYAKCDVLVPAFDKKFDDNKNDIEWLKKTIDIMQNRRGEDKANCLQSEFYEKATVQLYQLEPSSEAAYNLGQFYLKKEKPNYSEAAKYYQEASDLATDSTKKADYYYDAAVIASAQNQLSKSRNLAQNALNLNPNMGKAYILIGKLYVKSAGTCGENTFEQSQVYWLASDMMLKAKSVDPSLSDEANQLINAYSSKFPRKEDAFMYSIKPGDSVTINCWIQRSTTARFIK